MTGSLVVIVSGASKGLGQAIAADLLSAGHTVATYSRTRTPFIAETLASEPERFAWDGFDARDAAATRRFVLETERRFGRIDALVNNAGIAAEGVLPLVVETEVHDVIATNLEAAIFAAHACSRVMLRQGQGSIINISSIVGLRGYAGLSVYSATKAGLDGMTRALARELGPRGIRVNSIAPGYLETDLSATLSAPQRDQIVRRTPLGRLGTPADVTGLVRFLLSPEAAFLTGQILVVDGGLTC